MVVTYIPVFPKQGSGKPLGSLEISMGSSRFLASLLYINYDLILLTLSINDKSSGENPSVSDNFEAKV